MKFECSKINNYCGAFYDAPFVIKLQMANIKAG